MPRKIIPYNPLLKEISTEFRNNPTKSEAILWQQLKGKQIMGYDFHRQKPLLNYVVDFYCNELMLAIEIDGNVHSCEYAMMKDEIRQDAIEQFGVRFLRFKTFEVEYKINAVVSLIKEWIAINQN